MTVIALNLPGVDISRVLADVLAILAIVLAVLHARGLRRQIATVNQLASITERIHEALPTKLEGKFPGFLPKIVDLVRSANDSITIFCDFPAYGSFSDPDAFHQYHRAIEDKIRKLKKGNVTIACLSLEARADETRHQELRAANAWDTYKAKRRETFKRYLEFHSHKFDADTLSNEDFTRLVIEEDNQILQFSFRGASVVDLSQRPTVYFWLIDDVSMIFVIPSATRLDEYGFYTQDAHLIASLKEIARATSELFGGPISTSVGAAG